MTQVVASWWSTGVRLSYVSNLTVSLSNARISARAHSANPLWLAHSLRSLGTGSRNWWLGLSLPMSSRIRISCSSNVWYSGASLYVAHFRHWIASSSLSKALIARAHLSSRRVFLMGKNRAVEMRRRATTSRMIACSIEFLSFSMEYVSTMMLVCKIKMSDACHSLSSGSSRF